MMNTQASVVTLVSDSTVASKLGETKSIRKIKTESAEFDSQRAKPVKKQLIKNTPYNIYYEKNTPFLCM